MGCIVSLFWNREEHRIRALWRLLAQGALWGILLIGSQVGLVVAAFALGFVSFEQLADQEALMAFLLGTPAVLIALQVMGLAITLISVWLAGRFLDRRPFSGFGLRLRREWWIDFGFGLFLGALLMALVFVVELAAGWLTITGTLVTGRPGAAFGLVIWLAVLNFVIVGFQEELFSRGYQLTNLAEGLNLPRIGPRGAILIATLLSSAVFGLLHATNPNATAFSTFNLFLAGLFLAAGYVLTGDLAIPIGLHITWNFFQGNVFGFPVSGTDLHFATFIAVEQGGPELWTGGPFGPEGGLIGIAAMLLGTALIALWVRLRRGRAALHTPIAEAPEKPGPLFAKRKETDEAQLEA